MQSIDATGKKGHLGALIVNADDLGRDRNTTDCIFDCVRCSTVSSVSAMVFMEDSRRAAELAQDHRVDAGLHLNFTLGFSDTRVPSQLLNHQARISRYLRQHRLSQAVFHPGLARSFEYLVETQRDEFTRLYKREPLRIDGHHHMHLCANVLFGGLLPSGTIVRRNFSFSPGEKGLANRCYRGTIDWVLGRHHLVTNFFFSIQPLASLSRLQQIVDLSRHHVVELETHPKDPAEYAFLTGHRAKAFADHGLIASHYDLGPYRSC
jgi:hypothetical protein